MVNRGIAPADLTTPVGKFRLRTKDTAYTELDPVEPGFGNYAKNSDAEIEAYLESGGDSVFRALGDYYLDLASDAAEQSYSIKDQDLAVDMRQRSEDYREIAQDWYDRADQEDDLNGTSDIFEIVPNPLSICGGRCAELVPCGRCSGVYTF